MRWPAILLLPLLLAVAPQPRELLAAIHVDGAIWLLREDGTITRLVDGTANAAPVPMPVRALGLCRAGQSLIVTGNGRRAWQIVERRADRWRVVSTTPALPDENYVGTACSPAGVTLLTDRRLIARDRPPLVLTNFNRGMAIRTVLYREADALLVGTNAGEWGGKLIRITLATGIAIEVPDVGAPIHDIAAAPGKPGCVVLAIGLVHFFPSGKLTELCGDKATRLYARPWDPPGVKSKPQVPDSDPYPSVAFYALAPAADGGLRAIGMDGIYRVAPDGRVTGPDAMPDYEARGDYRTARAAPDLDLVLTGINARASMGGQMSIALPR